MEVDQKADQEAVRKVPDGYFLYSVVPIHKDKENDEKLKMPLKQISAILSPVETPTLDDINSMVHVNISFEDGKRNRLDISEPGNANNNITMSYDVLTKKTQWKVAGLIKPTVSAEIDSRFSYYYSLVSRYLNNDKTVPVCVKK